MLLVSWSGRRNSPRETRTNRHFPHLTLQRQSRRVRDVRGLEEWRHMLKALGYPVLAVGLVMGLQTFIPTAPAALRAGPRRHDDRCPSVQGDGCRVRAEPAIVAPKPVLVHAARSSSARPWPTRRRTAATVTVAPWRTAVVAFESTDGAKSAGTSATAASSADRYELARNIQRELKRVGCYYGAIDGSWGWARSAPSPPSWTASMPRCQLQSRIIFFLR